MKRPLRTLQVVNALGVGGAETWLMELLRFWSKSGEVQMDFLLTSGRSAEFDEQARALGSQLFYLPYGRAHVASFVRGLRQLLASGRYDAVHDHADYPSGFHFLAGLGDLPPVRITHLHNPWLHIEANYATRRSRRLAMEMGKALVGSLATHVCGTSTQVIGEYGYRIDQWRPRVSVVHCGFEVGRFNGPREGDRSSVRAEFGWDPSTRIVLFCGRLDQDVEINHPRNHKNSWLAVHIARAALDLDPSVRLLMAGGGESQKREIERRIHEWGLAGQLKLIGVRDDVGRLMRAADVFLFPSAAEGLGMATVEAQAAGLPTLASSVVPQEAVVIPSLFDRLGLDRPIEDWARALLERMGRPGPTIETCRAKLEASPFNVVNSAQSLIQIYGSAPQ